MYKIFNKEFKTKTEIKDYVHKIMFNNPQDFSSEHKYKSTNYSIKGEDFTGDTLEFFKEFITYHPDKHDPNSIARIYTKTRVNRAIDNVALLMICKKDHLIDSEVSINKCINNIPPINVVKISYVFKSGKYVGKNIEEINDNDYIKELLKWEGLKQKERTYFIQFLKYGFIPYNDHGFVNKG